MMMGALVCAMAASGCSYKIGQSAVPKDDEVVTGSITPAAQVDAMPTETDLAFARTAASDVLTRGPKDSSQPWENPKTGARGSVTPLASSYTSEDGRTCRDFLASYVNGHSEAWLQGEACRGEQGRWEIRTLKPWKRS
jgi:surface antigen